jgi:MFS family permease
VESTKNTAYLERFKAALSPGAIALLSLLLLGYVGLGETLRSYPGLQHDRLVAQGEVVQTEMNTFLQAGLPLRQFVGFETLAAPLVDSDSLLQSIVVSDLRGSILFSASAQGRDPVSALPDQPLPIGKTETGLSPAFTIQETPKNYIAVLPLENKFETVGFLSITLDKVSILSAVKERFGMVFGIMLALAAIILLGAFFLHGFRSSVSGRWLQPFFAAIFIIAMGVVTTVTIQIYSQGVQAKASALADSLSTRVGTVLDLGLNLEDISGVNQALIDYHQRNPELDSVALTLNGEVAYHNDKGLIGRQWSEPEDCFVYRQALLPEGQNASEGQVSLVLAVPKSVVYSRVARNVKNFAVLFLATVFLTALFFKLSVVLEDRKRKKEMSETATAVTDASGLEALRELEYDSDSSKAFRLALLKPLFFVAVFLEAMNASFLPQLIQEVSVLSGLGAGFTAQVFILFFLAFALTLVPAGKFAEVHGSRGLLLTGSILTASSQILLAFIDTASVWVQAHFGAGAIEILCLARVVSGIGQGFLLIGTQAFILENTPESRRTQGNNIIVYGYNGGIISGAAIGALLAVYLGYAGVFLVAGIVGVLCATYVFVLLPSRDSSNNTSALEEGNSTQPGGLKQYFSGYLDVFKILGDLKFLNTIIAVGIPTKAILTGVTIFAIPLILSELDYAADDIGQIIMIYGLGVVLASHFISRQVDRTGSSTNVLFGGVILSSIGLMLIGVMLEAPATLSEILDLNLEPFSGWIEATALISGVLLLGLAHGFINAPVVTHVAEAKVAKEIGLAPSTAIYRFLERLGHVAGPLIVAQFLLWFGMQPSTLLYIALVVVILGLIFRIVSFSDSPSAREPAV